MKADGSAVRRISPPGDTVRGRPRFLTDSHQVIANRRAGDTTVVVAFPLSGEAPRVIARIVEFSGGAVPFPDGQKYVYGIGGWAQTQLEVARLDGTGKLQLTNARAAHWCPEVSRQGDRIAVGRRDSATWQIWMVNADGSNGHAVVSNTRAQGSTECPRWSHDGKRIAFQSGLHFPADTTKSISNIWVVDVTGAHLLKLAPHDDQPWQDETPAWFPNGKRIAFQSDRTGAWEIWTMNADGSDARQLTQSPKH